MLWKGKKQGGHIVSQHLATGRGIKALCDITKGQLPDFCHSWEVDQGEELMPLMTSRLGLIFFFQKNWQAGDYEIKVVTYSSNFSTWLEFDGNNEYSTENSNLGWWMCAGENIPASH